MVGRRSSGRGCIGAFVVIFIVIFAIVVIAIYTSMQAASSAISGAVAAGATAENSSDLKTDPTLISDLQIMHSALDSRMATWQAQNDTDVHHLSASDAGLPADFNTKEVVYGHCTTSQFYVFVLNVTKPDGLGADTEGYEYVPGSTPQSCTPAGWNVETSEDAAPDWYFVTLNTISATASPAAAQSSGG